MAATTPRTPGRYERSVSGMTGALLVTVLVILAFVAFRAFNRTSLDEKPQHVDYLAQIRYAQQAGSQIVYPATLPSGWYATHVTVSAGTPSEVELSMLTAENKYVGFVESPQPIAELLGTYVDSNAEEGGRVTVGGGLVSRWSTWTDSGGDTALVGQRGHGAGEQNLMVFGTVSLPQLEQLARSLTTANVRS